MENLEISILVDDSSIKGNLTIVPNSTALVVFVMVAVVVDLVQEISLLHKY